MIFEESIFENLPAIPTKSTVQAASVIAVAVATFKLKLLASAQGVYWTQQKPASCLTQEEYLKDP